MLWVAGTGLSGAVLAPRPRGVQNDKRESVGFETEAYAIADTINVCCLMAHSVAASRVRALRRDLRSPPINCKLVVH